jgi:hypothetical protein
MADPYTTAEPAARGGSAPWLSMTLGLAFTALFVWGIISIVQRQLARGDSYPTFSTPSTTPSGIRAISDALKAVPGLEVRQDNRNYSLLKGGSETVYIIAGLDIYTYVMSNFNQPLSLLELGKIQTLPENGATLLITFVNLADDPHSRKNLEQTRTSEKENFDSEEEAHPAPEFGRAARTSRLGGRMLEAGSDMQTMRGMDFRVLARADAGTKTDEGHPRVEVARVTAAGTALQLDKELTWKSYNYLALGKNWTVLYTTPEGRPAIAMRSWGKGRVVASACTDWLSNEGLHAHPASHLLAWLVDGKQKILFLEKHLGFQDTRGVMWMAREHGMMGFVFGMMLLIALFLWKNATSLAPRLDLSSSEERGAILLGQDSSEGFLNLLSRNIPREQILPKAYASWVKWRAARSPAAANRAGAMEEEMKQSLAAAAGEKGTGKMSEADLVRAYKKMAALLHASSPGGAGTANVTTSPAKSSPTNSASAQAKSAQTTSST